MKTQFVITVTQTGENPATPGHLEGVLRPLVKDGFPHLTGRITVRHMLDDEKVATDSDHVVLSRKELEDALVSAHRDGQNTGRQLSGDSWRKARGYALGYMATSGDIPPAAPEQPQPTEPPQA